MNIELECRYLREPSETEKVEIEERLESSRIISGDKFNYNEEYRKLVKELNLYEYGPFTFNLRDVKYFDSLDSKHTSVRFIGGEIFSFKIHYEEFKVLYQSLLGITINEIGKHISFNKQIDDGR